MEEVKLQRSAAKRSVTRFINKIKYNLENNIALDSNITENLEKAYERVCECHEKCIDLLGEDESYLEPINDDYFSIIALIEKSKLNQRLKPINRDIKTLNNLLDIVESSLDNSTYDTLISLKYDLDYILTQKQILVKHQSNLSNIGTESSPKELELEELLERTRVTVKRLTLEVEHKKSSQVTPLPLSPSVDSQATIISPATTKVSRRHSTGANGWVVSEKMVQCHLRLLFKQALLIP